MATVLNSISFESSPEESYRERYLNNIGNPLRCMGFHLNTAILTRIKLGLRVVSVKVVDKPCTDDPSNIDLWVYEIVHVFDVR